MPFPTLPPTAPAVGDPGHTEDHGELSAALAYVRDNYVPAVVADTEPPGLEYGTLWIKPRRDTAVPSVMTSWSNSLGTGATSVTCPIDVPAGCTALFIGSMYTPSAPMGTLTLGGVDLGAPLESVASGASGSDRAVALFVVPAPAVGAMDLVQAGSAVVPRGIVAVALRDTAEAPTGGIVKKSVTGANSITVTPDGAPALTFVNLRTANPATVSENLTKLQDLAQSGSSYRVGGAWQDTAGDATWSWSTAADVAACIGVRVL